MVHVAVGRGVELVKLLLADLRPKFKVYGCEGKNNARSWARRLQSELREPVALVIDSDRIEPDEQGDVAGELKFLLGILSGGVPFHLCLFHPSIEVLFFHEQNLLEHLLRRDMHAIVFRAGAHAPKQVLEDLTPAFEGDRVSALVPHLDADDIGELRTLSPIRELRAFIKETQ